MSDDSEDFSKKAKPIGKVTDVAEIGKQIAAASAAAGEPSGALKKAMKNMERQMLPLRGMHNAIERQMTPFRDIGERMEKLRMAAGDGSALGRLSKQILDQQDLINKLPKVEHTIPRLPDLKPIHNPAHETNERLGRIEERFSQMQVIATDAAHIATGLQAAAAEFLQKFESAAADNNVAARRGIRIGIAAVLIAVTMPTAQILYTEFRREPDSGPAIEAVVSDMRAELSAAQYAVSRLSEALASSNKENAAILHDIQELLLNQASASEPTPGDRTP